MERKRIVLEFNPDGTVKVMPRGYAGGECHEATRALEQALGAVLTTSDTPEAFMTEISPDGTVKA